MARVVPDGAWDAAPPAFYCDASVASVQQVQVLQGQGGGQKQMPFPQSQAPGAQAQVGIGVGDGDVGVIGDSPFLYWG